MGKGEALAVAQSGRIAPGGTARAVAGKARASSNGHNGGGWKLQ